MNAFCINVDNGSKVLHSLSRLKQGKQYEQLLPASLLLVLLALLQDLVMSQAAYFCEPSAKDRLQLSVAR